MYRNQYILLHKSKTIQVAGLIPVIFDNLVIYANPSLNVTLAGEGPVKIALIGFIIDPGDPAATNSQIVSSLVRKCRKYEDLFEATEGFTGRYVLIYKNELSFIVTGDACHLRQIYYGKINGSLICTSSPRLFLDAFKIEPSISAEKMEIINNSSFIKNESIWYGDESIDTRLKKLLPNHYLDLSGLQNRRIPVFSLNNFKCEEQIFNYVAVVLRNTFMSLADKYKLLQPLTAGWDSRVLLAASRYQIDRIRYYVFDESSGTSPDAWIPARLGKKLDLDFKILQPGVLRDDFIYKYKKEHIYPRILAKTNHIQHHYDSNHMHNVLNVNGNCAEIARCYYGYTSGKITPGVLFTFAESAIKAKFPYFRTKLQEWYDQALQYSADSGIPMMDLFYWEQRIGNWHALWPFEQDFALEEISPFNNRALLKALLMIKPQQRTTPRYHFIKRLIEYLWKDVLSEPINPKDILLPEYFKSNTLIRYMGVKARSIFSS
jgi:hypothetical protein